MGFRAVRYGCTSAWDMGFKSVGYGCISTGEWAWKGAEWVRGTFGVYGGGFGELLGNFWGGFKGCQYAYIQVVAVLKGNLGNF